MNNKLIKNTISKVVNIVKNRANSLKSRITSALAGHALVSFALPFINDKDNGTHAAIAKKTVKVNNKTYGILDVILNVLNNYTLFKTIFKILGPKFKLLAPFLIISFKFFRRSFTLFAYFNTLYAIIILVVWYNTGRDIDTSIFALFQLIIIQFNWLLEYWGYNLDTLLSILKNQLNKIAYIFENNNTSNSHDDDEVKKSSNVISEMKKTHDAVKDTDIIKNSTINYYVIAGIFLTFTAIIATIYFNPYGITDLLIGFFHTSANAAIESIKEWTSSWVRPRYGDDDDNLFRRIRWSAIFTPWRRNFRREELDISEQEAVFALENTDTVPFLSGNKINSIFNPYQLNDLYQEVDLKPQYQTVKGTYITGDISSKK